MKTIAAAAAIIAAAATISATATPAFAQAEGRFEGAKVTFDAKANSYCFEGSRTGSRIVRSDCRTKEEWAKAGLNITHKPAVQLAQR